MAVSMWWQNDGTVKSLQFEENIRHNRSFLKDKLMLHINHSKIYEHRYFHHFIYTKLM